MNNKLLTRLENIKNVTNDLNKSKLQYIDLFYGSNKYKLYLFPEPTRILDWYDAINCAKILNGDLPTIVELKYLYVNYRNYFNSIYYWSSAEYDSTNAKVVGFNSGNTTISNKYFTYSVRFVRRVYL